jgi:hypothetical protein
LCDEISNSPEHDRKYFQTTPFCYGWLASLEIVQDCILTIPVAVLEFNHCHEGIRLLAIGPLPWHVETGSRIINQPTSRATANAVERFAKLLSFFKGAIRGSLRVARPTWRLLSADWGRSTTSGGSPSRPQYHRKFLHSITSIRFTTQFAMNHHP